MQNCLLIMVTFVVLLTGCTRRPVRNDVNTPEGPATRQANVDDEIKSSPGADQAPYELQFIDTVVELQLRAIDAEQLVATRAEHVELKQFSRQLIAEQRSEITTLRQLRASWFGDKPAAVYLQLAGASEALHAIDVAKLDPLKENAFDLEFIEEMTAYLKSVNRMGSDVLNEDSRAELKQVAQNIVNGNGSRVEQLKAWETSWKKS